MRLELFGHGTAEPSKTLQLGISEVEGEMILTTWNAGRVGKTHLMLHGSVQRAWPRTFSPCVISGANTWEGENHA